MFWAGTPAIIRSLIRNCCIFRYIAKYAIVLSDDWFHQTLDHLFPPKQHSEVISLLSIQFIQHEVKKNLSNIRKTDIIWITASKNLTKLNKDKNAWANADWLDIKDDSQFQQRSHGAFISSPQGFRIETDQGW